MDYTPEGFPYIKVGQSIYTARVSRFKVGQQNIHPRLAIKVGRLGNEIFTDAI